MIWMWALILVVVLVSLCLKEFKVCRLFNIDIYLEPSWFIIFILFTSQWIFLGIVPKEIETEFLAFLWAFGLT